MLSDSDIRFSHGKGPDKFKYINLIRVCCYTDLSGLSMFARVLKRISHDAIRIVLYKYASVDIVK